ncbi:MAG TPA: hypothetical protein VFV49_14615 [Thermoanaerobaculia bacterium]|nr:hypothetical protein [Thermoanaerobaculia bacterium]
MKRHDRILLACLIVVAGCAWQQIADYDPSVDQGAVQVQAKLDALFEDLQNSAGTPDGEYEHYASRYDDLRGNVAQLQSQAALQPHNELTSSSLTLLHDNLQQLELAHRHGLTAGQVPVLRKLFDTQLRMLVQLEVAKKRDAASAEVTP